ncbi:MAG: hypothetical protein AAF498_06275, partial [Pseudomonadota bacterium]
ILEAPRSHFYTCFGWAAMSCTLTGDISMRKWLIIIAGLVLILLGIGLWLSSKATEGRPPPGEIRQEISNVFDN